MPRRKEILSLSAALNAAGADWTALESASRALAQRLPALAAHGQWNDTERAALLQLRAVHARAFQMCSDEKERLASHMREIQANKEGWIAYALIGATDLDGNQV